ncbi:fungal-specific transcription factor domain-containing protein [Lineolata rhizophorae]|uniref:Fungal-specific transcription factor domain-containing protein n=1 Tax=Lineolata rhizophorae TaxID=578093 RepID=A0A6A6NWU5_9PEZI|nr:fungal-specific transcription factor domain-containing protein [Lineolata rhizophorae]
MSAEPTAHGGGLARAAALSDASQSPPHDPDDPPRKKQKRNKPTLSCDQCVSRKTKCDRSRPKCLACVKRQSECRYSEVANLIAASAENGARSASKARKHGKNESFSRPVPSHPPPQTEIPRPHYRSTSISSTSSSSYLLSMVPHAKHAPPSVFGINNEHPFSNYWTINGGLAEVIGVLPRKEDADMLTAKYFETVDGVYPMINRRAFYSQYCSFWALPDAERQKFDPTTIALHFVVYAMGTQFIQTQSPSQRAQISEFYVSAAHQSLRVSSYLSRTSIRTIQAMVLMCYFLMNDNHAPDAWAFGGILMRQAYAMGLHRDPDIIAPQATPAEKQQRRKVWQAVMFQDTFLTVLLKLPPSANFSDVSVDSLHDEPLYSPPDNSTPSGRYADDPPTPNSTQDRMSISSIAPNPMAGDVVYIRCMWRLANLVQRTFCEPRALNRPLATSTRAKVALLAQYRQLFDSFPPTLTGGDRATVERTAAANPRLARQNLFLRSNYWHCLGVLQADENEAGGVRCDVRGALEACRHALRAFFDLREFLPVDAGVWWVFQHRAFEEALMISGLLASVGPPGSAAAAATTQSPGLGTAGSGKGASKSRAADADADVDPDALYAPASADVRRMLEILERAGSGAPEMQKTRTEVLRKAYENIGW